MGACMHVSVLLAPRHHASTFRAHCLAFQRASMDRTSSTFDHPNLAVERAQSTFSEADMTDFLNGSHAETVVQKAIMQELEELKAKEASGAPIELDGGAASLDSAGIMPNQDHTLEEARLQTMKMLRFQYDRLFNAEDSSARMRRADGLRGVLGVLLAVRG